MTFTFNPVPDDPEKAYCRIRLERKYTVGEVRILKYLPECGQGSDDRTLQVLTGYDPKIGLPLVVVNVIAQSEAVVRVHPLLTKYVNRKEVRILASHCSVELLLDYTQRFLTLFSRRSRGHVADCRILHHPELLCPCPVEFGT